MRSKVTRLPFVWCLCFFTILSAEGSYANDIPVYTLEASIAEALANNWTLKAKDEKVEQAVDVKRQARSEFLPKLSTTYGYTRMSEALAFRSNIPGAPDIEVSSQDNYQWKGTITQPIFTGFALVSALELANLGIDQSETERELEKLDLILKVKEAYFGILIADKAVEVAEKDVEFRRSNEDVARSFYEVGMIPVNDLLRAEVELANGQQNLVTARNASRLARSSFNAVLSRDLDAPVEVEDILAYEAEKGSFEEYEKEAFENRPEIKLIDISLLQVDQDIRLAKSENYPAVNLTYNYIKEGDDYTVSGSPFHDAGRWEVLVGLSWTFWEWGKTRYSIREKESLKDELLKTRYALEDSIRLELKEALLALKNAEENIPTTEKAVEQGEENLRVNEERYKAQVTTITEVLDAQTLLTRARVNHYTALYNHKLAKARLHRAIGSF